MKRMTLQYYEGSVADKLRLAHQIYDTHGAALQQLPRVRSLLKLLPDLARQLAKRMREMGMDHLCSRCGGQDQGGCCSLEMANNCDALQLTMNLLLHSEVEVQRNDGVECSFLGTRGCSLLLKPMFCLNYNCTHIHRHNSVADMVLLERCSGSLLQAQTSLEGIITDYLRDKT